MGVREELRRLDEDLADGRLDSDTYRRRRDDLLATRHIARGADAAPAEDAAAAAGDAPSPRGSRSRSTPSQLVAGGPGRSGPPGPSTVSGPGPPSDPGTPPTHGATPPPLPATTPDEPLRPPPPPEITDAVEPEADAGATFPDPFPPPFRWDAPAGSADDTQIVGEPDRTQIVPAPGDRPGPDRADDAERTRVVAGSAVDRAPARMAEVTRPSPPITPGPPAGPRSSRRPPAPPASAVPWTPAADAWTPEPRRPLAPGPTPPAERTQVVPGPSAAVGGARAVPARDTAPPWSSGEIVPLGSSSPERMPGRELFVRGPGPRPATIAGTSAVVLLVVAVLVLSFVLG